MRQIHVQGVRVLVGETLVEHCNETNTCTGCEGACGRNPCGTLQRDEIHVQGVRVLMGETLVEHCNETNTCTGCEGARCETTLVECCNETNTCTGCRCSWEKPLWNAATRQIHVQGVGAHGRNPCGTLQQDKDMYRV